MLSMIATGYFLVEVYNAELTSYLTRSVGALRGEGGGGLIYIFIYIHIYIEIEIKLDQEYF